MLGSRGRRRASWRCWRRGPLFGVGSGTIWSAGLSWLGDSAPPEARERALASAITVAGVGSMVGPVFAGVLADHVGRGAAFAVVGVLDAAVVDGARGRAIPAGGWRHGHQPLAEVAAGMRARAAPGRGDRDHAARAASATASSTSSRRSSSATTASPPATIGAVALGRRPRSSSSSSAVVARMGRRAVSLRFAGAHGGAPGGRAHAGAASAAARRRSWRPCSCGRRSWRPRTRWRSRSARWARPGSGSARGR